MNEVFLALKPLDTKSNINLFSVEPGTCLQRWIHDASIISQYMNDGWFVFRVNGFQRIEQVDMILKMEKQNACDECPQSTKSDNKRGR